MPIHRDDLSLAHWELSGSLASCEVFAQLQRAIGLKLRQRQKQNLRPLA